MNAKTDRDLLIAYASGNSEPAFAELVHRHIHLVHSAAVRLLVDPHLAQDVTQGTFIALASNARKLASREVLSSWLLVTARNLAAKTVRTEERRRSREKEVLDMESVSSDQDHAWDRIAPHLDDALCELKATDRDALALRFFERKTAGEMGRCLGLSEEAAQKRVTRALERLRILLVKRGFAVPSATLAGLISVEAVQSAPVGMAATVTGIALASVPAGGGSVFFLLKAMTATNFKTTIFAALLLGGLVSPIILQRTARAHLLAENADLKQKVQLVAALKSENQQLRTAQSAVAMADPGTDEALQRERAEAEKQRTKLLRLRNQASARHLQAGDESERSAKQALKERLARDLAWTNVPPEKIKLEPAEGRFVLASVQNLGAGTPEATLNLAVDVAGSRLADLRQPRVHAGRAISVRYIDK